MITADQLLAHAVGDYIIQSDWMAAEKTKRNMAACVHAITYTLPFLFLTDSVMALLFIGLTHAVIDRWRLARFVVFAKNFFAPRSQWPVWADCRATGYPSAKPPFMAIWLLIIADNTMHVLCNAVALERFS